MHCHISWSVWAAGTVGEVIEVGDNNERSCGDWLLRRKSFFLPRREGRGWLLEVENVLETEAARLRSEGLRRDGTR